MTEQQKRILDRLDKAAEDLMGVVDSVEVVVTVRNLDEVGTSLVMRSGRGCWYSRYGALKEAVIHREEQMRSEAPCHRGEAE